MQSNPRSAQLRVLIEGLDDETVDIDGGGESIYSEASGIREGLDVASRDAMNKKGVKARESQDGGASSTDDPSAAFDQAMTAMRDKNRKLRAATIALSTGGESVKVRVRG